MFIPEFSFRNHPEPDELSEILSAVRVSRWPSQRWLPVSCWFDDLGGREGYRHPSTSGQMDALVTTRQPWRNRIRIRHLKIEYSDLRANYPTHDMLILTLPYAVKTSRPRF